jgi:signal transduction histidine kinase
MRYWQSYRLVRDEGGDVHYIFVETSLAHIDGLFASRIVTAYYWLFGILAVVLLLILRHVRLIDYGYLYRETKRAYEMQDLFTNMMAHELRAPLTAVKGYASLIEENQGAPLESRSQAEKIRDSAERLLLIVNDLLDVARIHGGKLQVKNERTEVKKVIAGVIDAMQPSAKEKNITLGGEGVLPEVWIQIDGRRFHQALTNLVSNAIKYTKAGAITIALEERRDRIEIRVKDTGMGISAEDQKNLFAPFFRVESEEVDRIVGTGLGMWTTKQLIEIMHGSIAVESIRGVGTHIVVIFPK